MRAFSRKESREVDRRACSELGIPSIVLMENAGAGASRIAEEMLAGAGGPVACLCGPGGNGGDALVVARHLAIAGFEVRIAVLGSPSAGDAAIQSAICRAMALPFREVPDCLSGASLVVDGIYGTGLSRAPADEAADTIAAMNDCGVAVLSLDLPSGLDCDTGEPLGACVRAAATATFVAPKLGFLNPRSRAFTGEVRVVGIGAPSEWPRTA